MLAIENGQYQIVSQMLRNKTIEWVRLSTNLTKIATKFLYFFHNLVLKFVHGKVEIIVAHAEIVTQGPEGLKQ